MTKDELILIGKAKVRGNSNLMSIYIDLYKEQFGRKPNCAGCTFSSDWDRFVSNTVNKPSIELKTKSSMENTFELKKKNNDMLRYVHEGKTYRKYANKLNESFAVAFLTYGTDSEIEDRKKLFRVLPDAILNKEELIEEQAISIDAINNSDDVELLKELLGKETRKTYLKAIEKRISKLEK